MYDIAICDDSASDREFLIERIQRNKICERGVRFHEYGSGEELLPDIKNIAFSIIFLDVQMGKMDGEETATEIRKIDPNVILMFCTGYAEPTPITFELQPHRYIFKNMSFDMMDKYINDGLTRMLEYEAKPALFVNVGRRQLNIRPDDIIYIEKSKRGIRVFITKQAEEKYGLRRDENEKLPAIRMNEKLEQVYERLKRCGFGYPHDSYIINFDKLKECTNQTFVMDGIEGEFKIARSKASTFSAAKVRFMTSKYVQTKGAQKDEA